jgi:anion transporter
MMNTTVLRHTGNRLSAIGARNGLALGLALVSALVIFTMPGELSLAGRMALTTFVLTVIGWTVTKLNDTFVALFAALGLVLTATIQTENLFASLGNSVVWLMIGAFIIARGLTQSGLSGRLTYLAVSRARTVGQLFWLLTWALLGTALLIPSTSARAALMVPVYQAMTNAFKDARINRALALMLPINILMSGVASLVGAGAHLVINDAVGQLTGQPFTFVEWLLMGLPFAIVSCAISTGVILHLFLDRERRQRALSGASVGSLQAPGALSAGERFMLVVTGVVVALWATESLHGIDNALVAVLGALATALPRPGVVKFKEAAKGIEWEMILFVAASLALSAALVESGAGSWLVHALLIGSGVADLGSQFIVLLGVTVITLTSHLYITSRSARGAVIAPLTVLLAFSLGFDPRILAFVTAAGVGYCITLTVSAKPLHMFQAIDGGEHLAFQPRDLLKASTVLAPVHVGLIVAFGLFYWPLFVGGAQAAQVNRPAAVSAQAQALSPAEARDLRLSESPLASRRPGLIAQGAFVPGAVLAATGLADRDGDGRWVFQPVGACTCATDMLPDSDDDDEGVNASSLIPALPVPGLIQPDDEDGDQTPGSAPAAPGSDDEPEDAPSASPGPSSEALPAPTEADDRDGGQDPAEVSSTVTPSPTEDDDDSDAGTPTAPTDTTAVPVEGGADGSPSPPPATEESTETPGDTPEPEPSAEPAELGGGPSSRAAAKKGWRLSLDLHGFAVEKSCLAPPFTSSRLFATILRLPRRWAEADFQAAGDLACTGSCGVGWRLRLTQKEFRYDPHLHEVSLGDRCSLWASHPEVAPEDEAVHLHRAQRHPHHRPAADGRLARDGLQPGARHGRQARRGAVRRHQTPGAGDHPEGSRTRRVALRQPALAGWHPHQLAHHQGADQ